MSKVRLQATAAYMAAAFGTFLAIGETVRNWGNWQWWPFWLVDYIAARCLESAISSPRRRVILSASVVVNLGMLGYFKYSSEQYESYQEANRLFADRLIPLLREDDCIWVHDYHLIPLARKLRQAGVTQPIGFYLLASEICV